MMSNITICSHLLFENWYIIYLVYGDKYRDDKLQKLLNEKIARRNSKCRSMRTDKRLNAECRLVEWCCVELQWIRYAMRIHIIWWSFASTTFHLKAYLRLNDRRQPHGFYAKRNAPLLMAYCNITLSVGIYTYRFWSTSILATTIRIIYVRDSLLLRYFIYITNLEFLIVKCHLN